MTTQRRGAVVTTTQAQENVATLTRPGEVLNTYTTATVQDTFTYTHHSWWNAQGRLVPQSLHFVAVVRNPGPDNVVQYPLPAEPKVSVTRTPVASVVTRTVQAAPAEHTESRRPVEPVVTETVRPGQPVVTVTYEDLPSAQDAPPANAPPADAPTEDTSTEDAPTQDQEQLP